MGTTLFVGKLPWSTTDSDLAAIFGRFGDLESAEVICERETKRSKGFGFVTFVDAGQAAVAAEQTNGIELGRQQLVVNFARLETEALRRLGEGNSRTDEQKAALLASRLRNSSWGRRYGQVSLPEAGVDLKPEVLTAHLHLPKEYSRRLQIVEYFPIRVFQLIASDPRQMYSMTSRQFEEFIAELISKLGFDDVLLTPQSCDGGRDIIAGKRINGIPMTFFFECKKYAPENPIRLNTLRAFLGVLAHEGTMANKGVLVTTSYFTKGCKDLIASECRLDGKDYNDIVNWIDECKQRP